MCGIVGAVSHRDVVPILMDGLRRLEYRGYDSAGIAVLKDNKILRVRVEGKVSILKDLLDKDPIQGSSGIAHTRWATHGKPSLHNAHPHIVADRIVVVHNGIIENYETLREKLSLNSVLLSETDTEIVAWCIYENIKKGQDFLTAVQETVKQLEGAFALCIMDVTEPDRIIGVRNGPPLVVGIGVDEHFLASDVLALQRFTEQFMYLEEGDIVDVSKQSIKVYDKSGAKIGRKTFNRRFSQDSAEKCGYRHFMLKEIFEQPVAISDTLNGRLYKNHVLEQIFGLNASSIFDKTKKVQIVACGTSYHAGLIARIWLESLANIPCQVEIASEFRYRKRAREKGDTLFVCISQSGETADTLAALRNISAVEYCGVLSICNVPNSSLVRESNLVLMTNAGPEIGVCSTKAFTTQLAALFLLVMVLGRRGSLDKEQEEIFIKELCALPKIIQETLALSEKIQTLAQLFRHKSHTLFLGRGLQFPIAQEGALKLKEISYIHAEAYPAGELKHGPLALVDKDMPVVVIAPKDSLLEKLKSNIQEVRARGGKLIVFTPKTSGIEKKEGLHILEMPEVTENLAPIVYTIPLQLLAYYVALLKGTDVDQPRNLAKSVTVE